MTEDESQMRKLDKVAKTLAGMAAASQMGPFGFVAIAFMETALAHPEWAQGWLRTAEFGSTDPRLQETAARLARWVTYELPVSRKEAPIAQQD